LLLLRRTLFPGVVDDVVGAQFTVQKNLRNGDKGITLLQQGFNQPGQGFRGMFCGVVEENDGAGLDFGGHSFGDFRG